MRSDLRQRCEEVLKQENYTTEPWVCPVCGDDSSRAHYIADHILKHLNDTSPSGGGIPGKTRWDLIEME